MLLAQKTTILILISTMRRRHELLAMHLDHVFYYPNSMVFALDVYPKTFTLRNRLENLRYITIRTFPENPNLCPLRTLQEYLRKTSIIRNSRKVFIITQTPFKGIAKLTLRRWVLTGLANADVDVEKYAAGCIRHASSSKAYYAGVSIDTVLLRAGWTQMSSFVTHYNLPIQKPQRKPTLAPTSSVAPPRLVSKSAFFYSSPRKQKTAADVMAHKLLCRSGNNVLKINSQFHCPFAAPPPKLKRKVLKTGKRVVIPQSPVKQFPHTRKKPYVLYVKSVPEDVVPSTSGNSNKIHDDSSTE